ADGQVDLRRDAFDAVRPHPQRRQDGVRRHREGVRLDRRDVHQGVAMPRVLTSGLGACASLAILAIALGASALPAQEKAAKAERRVRLDLADGTQIVGILVGETDDSLRVRTGWGGEIAVPKKSVVLTEDVGAATPTRPTSVVRFELDPSGAA